MRRYYSLQELETERLLPKAATIRDVVHSGMDGSIAVYLCIAGLPDNPRITTQQGIMMANVADRFDPVIHTGVEDLFGRWLADDRGSIQRTARSFERLAPEQLPSIDIAPGIYAGGGYSFKVLQLYYDDLRFDRLAVVKSVGQATLTLSDLYITATTLQSIRPGPGPQQKRSVSEQRLVLLQQWIDQLRQAAPELSISKLPVKRLTIQTALEAYDPIFASNFAEFWKTQNLIACSRGRAAEDPDIARLILSLHPGSAKKNQGVGK